MNYDGGRGENYGTVKIKVNAQPINYCKETLKFEIGRRISEEDVIYQISNSHFTPTGVWLSEF